jgi:type I restriction enzyme S subunit
MSWPNRRLEEICSFKTGKLDSNAAVINGEFPFFTCAQETYRIDKAAFNTEAVLLGGNNAAGIFPLKYYKGQFNAYQRTYVIEALDSKTLSTRYLYYALSQALTRFQSVSIGAATQYLTKSILDNFLIALPPIAIQDSIVEILGSYDDLIENNRRRMALLEESARLLYREWFIRLRFPGYEHTRIVDGVPEGWNKGVVSDFYETSSGGTPSRKIPGYFTGEIPWVKTQELPNAFITDTQEKITEQALKNSSAKLFPDRTVLVALYGATVGEIGILSMPATTNQACCAIIPLDERANFIHAFLFFRENKEKLVNLSAGAAQNNISQQIIRACEMIMPNSSLMNIFVESLAPVFDQWLNLQQQNQKLRAARDLLLPRLMSGEIPV